MPTDGPWRMIDPDRLKRRVVQTLIWSCLLLATGCQHFYEVPTHRRPEPAVEGVDPLRTEELLRYSSNLGEVEPGLLYRSAQPDRAILDFLHERVQLGHILTLRGQASSPGEQSFLADNPDVKLHSLTMSAFRSPSPREIIKLIDLTHEARRDGRSILMHCQAGADRTGVMGAVWRMLFQDVDDKKTLHTEATLYGHVHPNIVQLHNTIDTFRKDLFLPFVENPELVDDEDYIKSIEDRYFDGYALDSGDIKPAIGSLSAGVGKADLTENLERPIQMATYGPLPGKSSEIREAVFARAVVLEVSGKRVALVGVDLLIMDRKLREEVLQRSAAAGLNLNDVLISATHTHTSIGSYVDRAVSEIYMLGEFSEKMRTHLASRIVEAMRLAIEDLEPVSIGATRTTAPYSANRRIGTLVDPSLGVLRLQSEDGNPKAVIAHFAAHPILEPKDGTIAADYPGRLCRKLDETYGFGLFLQGALGDINARANADRDQYATDGLAETVANGLFERVRSVVEEIETKPTARLFSLTRSIRLPDLNLSLIPDLLFPLDWWLSSLLDWPEFAILQVMQIGPVAIIASSSELAVRPSLQIKLQSPAEHAWVLSLANDYSGYAVTANHYAKSKTDATSIPTLHGSRHARRIVDESVRTLQFAWGDTQVKWKALSDTTRDDSLIDAPAIDTQSPRRLGGVGDSTKRMFRVEASFAYTDALAGGGGLVGTRSDINTTLRLALPADVRSSLEFGHSHSSFRRPNGTRNLNDTFNDLRLSATRPFRLWTSEAGGNALRLSPRVGISAPTGDANSSIPFAFTSATGVWRPSIGFMSELTWESYRTLHFGADYIGAIGRYNGRQPGDRIESFLGYAERHGCVSLYLDVAAEVLFADSRNGGTRTVDLSATSFRVELRPAIRFHLSRFFEPFIELRAPVARGGTAGDSGMGVLAGIELKY